MDLRLERPVRIPAAIILLGLAPGLLANQESRLPPLLIEEQEQLALRVTYLATGESGTVEAGTDTLKIPAGRRGTIERTLDLAVAGGLSEPVTLVLAISGRAVDDTLLELDVEARVTASGETTHRSRRGQVLDGSALLVDLHGSDRDGRRRLLALVGGSRTIEPLVERRDLDLRPIDLRLDVSYLAGEEGRSLETVRLTTISDHPVDYAFRLHLPAEVLGAAPDGGIEMVAVTVTVLPRRLADGRIDLLVRLSDTRGRPWTTGTPLDRIQRRAVEPGDGITLDLTSIQGGLTYRFHVAAYY